MIDLAQAVSAVNTPSVETIIDGFALVVALFILRAVASLYKQGIQHEGLPAAVEALAVDVRAAAARFDAHCQDEERVREQIRVDVVRAANVAQVSLSKVETAMNDRFDKLEHRISQRRVRKQDQ